MLKELDEEAKFDFMLEHEFGERVDNILVGVTDESVSVEKLSELTESVPDSECAVVSSSEGDKVAFVCGSRGKIRW